MEIRDELFIAGDWVAPSKDETIDVVSPSSQEVIARVPHAAEADVDRAAGLDRG